MAAREEATAAPPGKVEATASAVAGPAFAASLLLLRDATLLPPSIFDAAAAIVASIGLAPLVHRARGAAFATLARAAGVVVGILLLTPALAPPFDRAVPTLALWTLGAAVLQANTRATRERIPVAALGIAILTGGAALAFATADAFPEPQRLRVAIGAASVVALAGLAARVATRRSRFRAFAPRPIGILLVAAFGAIYLAYRGLVETQVENLALYEWTLAVAVAGLVLTRLRRTAQERATTEAWASTAQRHAQDVAPVYDRRMAPHVAAVARYLETGMGFDEYRATVERAAEGAVPPGLARALDAAQQAGGATRGRGGRRNASAARRDAHRAVLDEMTIPERGPPHGTPEPRVRANP